MLGRDIGLILGCALGASAFLLPSGTTATTADKAVSLTPFEIDAKNQVVELPCSSCAFPADRVTEKQESDGIVWAQGGANNLVLNFTVSEDGHRLLLNDGQIYPLQFGLLPEWSVQQVPASTTREQLKTGDYQGTTLEITGYNLFRGVADVLTTSGDSVLSLTWQLTSLNGQSMTLDEVFIQMIETSDGELLILSIDPVPGTAPQMIPALKEPEQPTHFRGGPEKLRPYKQCKLPHPLCAIGEFIESKVFGVNRITCSGVPGPFTDGHLPSHVRPHFGHHDRPEHSHGRHHKHGILHSFVRGFLSILVPVLAGVTVGMLVSVLGLMTGRFIGWLWFTVIRGGKRGYARVASNDIIITVTDADKKETIVVDDTEALPRYKNAPAYEETEKEVL